MAWYLFSQIPQGGQISENKSLTKTNNARYLINKMFFDLQNSIFVKTADMFDSPKSPQEILLQYLHVYHHHHIYHHLDVLIVLCFETFKENRK